MLYRDTISIELSAESLVKHSVVALLVEFVEDVRRLLVDVVVEPVGKEQVRDAAPAHDGLLRRIVIGIVVLRDLRMHTSLLVAVVLLLERQRVVLCMARDEELALLEVGDGVDAGIPLGLRQDCELRHLLDVLAVVLRMARVRHEELIVEAAEELLVLDAEVMLVDAEDLLWHLVLRDAVVVVEAGLRAPADVERRVDMRLAPLHDLRDLIPVGDFLEWHHLNGRARDDHAIVLLVADFCERAVELRQVFLRGMARRVRLGVDEVHLDLQRRIAEQA